MRSIFILLTLLPGLSFTYPYGNMIRSSSSLTVSQEAGKPAAKTPKTSVGSVQFTFNSLTNTLYYSIHFSHLSGAPTMAHFHLGSIGSNGPVLQTICGQPAPTLLGACPGNDSGSLQGKWQLTSQQALSLFQGNIFVNIHTALNPQGEIRGQLVLS